MCTHVVYTHRRAQTPWVAERDTDDAPYTLSYKATEHGDTLPHFGGVGYRHGSDLPNVPAALRIGPVPGDNTAHLQAAIDAVAALPLLHDGGVAFRGALELARGQYDVSSTLTISASGVVLRGSGAGTVLKAAAKHTGPIVKAAGTGYRYPVGPAVAIVRHVASGASSISVPAANASEFSVGDHVVVYRRATAEWISSIGMDAIPNCGPEATRTCDYWDPQWYHISYERVVTAVSGGVLELDLPIVSSIGVGVGTVFRFAFPGRISQVGVESLSFVAGYDSAWQGDEQHAATAVQMDKLEHGYVNSITCAQFWYACVSVEVNAKHVTVLDASNVKPVSKITGGRRYAFNLHGSASLFSRCKADRGRHDFVSQYRAAGPNVFYNSHSTNAYNDIGPHHRWAQGILFDSVTTKKAAFSGGWCNIQDRGNSGSGHGWTATAAVFYNCKASHGIKVESPPGSTNWGIGCTAPKLWGGGAWESKNLPVTPPSLYIAQRRAAGLQARSPERSEQLFGAGPGTVCKVEAGVDFFGTDISNHPAADVSQCVKGCVAAKGCLFFTYVWGSCWYKASDAGRHPLASAVSGSCNVSMPTPAPTAATVAAPTASPSPGPGVGSGPGKATLPPCVLIYFMTRFTDQTNCEGTCLFSTTEMALEKEEEKATLKKIGARVRGPPHTLPRNRFGRAISRRRAQALSRAQSSRPAARKGTPQKRPKRRPCPRLAAVAGAWQCRCSPASASPCTPVRAVPQPPPPPRARGPWRRWRMWMCIVRHALPPARRASRPRPGRRRPSAAWASASGAAPAPPASASKGARPAPTRVTRARRAPRRVAARPGPAGSEPTARI